MKKIINNDEYFDIFDGIELNEDEKKIAKEVDKIANLMVKIIKRRNELGLSQRDIAQMTGIKQPMIARIEKLDSMPRIDTLLKIANAIGLDLTFEDTSIGESLDLAFDSNDFNLNCYGGYNFCYEHKKYAFINLLS